VPEPIVVMRCPLCGNGLTAVDQLTDGRFRCGLCSANSAEAKRGWLPRSAIEATRARIRASVSPDARRGEPTPIGDDPMFAKNAAGQVITREAVCECTAPFTQIMLSERFMSLVERAGPGALSAVMREIPGLYVPVHCPKCERVDLGHAGRIGDARASAPQNRDLFVERQHAAD
jgi:hypothetical protein